MLDRGLTGLVLFLLVASGLLLGPHVGAADKPFVRVEGAKAALSLELTVPAQPQSPSAQVAPRLLVEGAAVSWRTELGGLSDLAATTSAVGPRILVEGAATSTLRVVGAPSAFLAATAKTVPRILTEGAVCSLLVSAGGVSLQLAAGFAPAPRILIQGAPTGAECKLAQPAEPPPVPIDGGAVPVWIWVLLGALVGGVAVWLLARR